MRNANKAARWAKNAPTNVVVPSCHNACRMMSQLDMMIHQKQWQGHHRSCKLSAFWQQERLEPSIYHAAPAYEPPQPTQQQMRQLTEDEIAQGCKLDPFIGMRVKRLWPEVCLSFPCMSSQAWLHCAQAFYYANLCKPVRQAQIRACEQRNVAHCHVLVACFLLLHR